MALEPEKLRGMSSDELKREEKDLRDQIWKLRLQLSTGQLDNPQKVRAVRRDLARVLTAQREREGAAASAKRR
jgi:large subunit ribosomal protein L29